MNYTTNPPRVGGVAKDKPINTVKIAKNAEGEIVMRTEVVEERILNKQNLLQHRHNLEMEMVRAEENLLRIKNDIEEINEIITDYMKEES